MRFEVPQFIEIEDKVIGPLTWRQFVYLAGGVGILVILFLSAPFILAILFGLPIAALSFSLAFHRVNNRPFSLFLESAARYTTKSKLYLWKRESSQTVTNGYGEEKQQSSDLSSVHQNSISALTKKLELNQSER